MSISVIIFKKRSLYRINRIQTPTKQSYFIINDAIEELGTL